MWEFLERLLDRTVQGTKYQQKVIRTTVEERHTVIIVQNTYTLSDTWHISLQT